MEERAVNHRELESLPDVVVSYWPEERRLSIQAGNPVWVDEGEQVANGLTAFYDKEGSLVAIDLDSAELLLKPFLDAARRATDTLPAEVNDPEPTPSP